MSRHEYKFGDRVTYTGAHQVEHKALVTMVTSCGRYVNVVWQDSGADYVSTSYSGLTPGWPDPPDHVRVRAAVTIESTGDWNCYGGMGVDDAEMRDEASGYGVEIGDASAVHFIEAMVPLPKQETIEAEVVS